MRSRPASALAVPSFGTWIWSGFQHLPPLKVANPRAAARAGVSQAPMAHLPRLGRAWPLAFSVRCHQSARSVQALLKKIEATAKKQLVLPKGRKPGDEIARYKRWLKQESHRLKIEHRAGADGLTVCRARAHVLDLLLQHFWEATKANLSAQARQEFPQIAIVALGGYGRAELSPHSDIDFMFLHNRSVVGRGVAHPYLTRMIDGVLYPLREGLLFFK